MATASSGWSCTHNASIIEETNTTVKIRVKAYWQNAGWTYDINNVSAWVYCNNDKKQVASGVSVKTTSSTSASAKLGEYDYTISKTTSSQSISCHAKITSESTYVSGSKYSTATTINVSAKPSYTVSYNANGGSGAPSSQTKWYGTNLTLSASKPSRTGYTFAGWNTNSSGTGTNYAAGATYTGNATLTLYAKWTPHTYTVSYNANGGSGAPGNQTKTYGVNLTLSSTKPSRTNYNFLGWSTSANGGVVYNSGATYTNNSAVTLYAVWELGYTKPRITNFSAYRCTSNGTASESGTYVKASFDWSTDYDLVSMYIDWTIGTNWANRVSEKVTTSGRSGHVSQIVGGGNISTETTYSTRGWVNDGNGSTYSDVITIGTVKYPIDVKAGGTGVAIGKVAEDDIFDVRLPAKFRSPVTIDESVTVKGANLLGGPGSIYQQFTVGGEADIYYPVLFELNGYYGGRSGFPYAKFTISRGYAWAAPDTWYNPTHKGGLTFSWFWTGDGGWGGNDGSLKVLRLNETYSTMVSGIELSVEGVVVWLRGGGALYQLDNEFGLSVSITVYESGFTARDETTYSPISYNASKVTNTIKKQSITPYVKSATAKTHTDFDNNQYFLPDLSFISHWNGAYNSGNRSCLTYCIEGPIQAKPTSLYDNSSGSNGTITLSETSANFIYLEIYFKDNNGVEHTSTKVYSPNGKETQLFTVEATSSNTFIRRTYYNISGTTLTPSANSAGYVKLTDGGNSHTLGTNLIYVTKVVGYK